MSPRRQLRWSTRARRDLIRIAAYWEQTNRDLAPAVFEAINSRIAWVQSGNYLLGARLPGLGADYRVVRDRRFGYAVYYRLEGTTPDSVAIVAIRHGRQRPLQPSTIRRYSRI